jgi:hypothetical protein
VTRRAVAKTLLERYTKMQALQTATITALGTTNSEAAAIFGISGLSNQPVTSVDSKAFDRSIAMTVAGKYDDI